MRIKAPSPATEVGALSGGNQQKVALARWLAIRPAVLILDEPTQGVDVGSKAEIHALMQTLAERGLAIIMISSELPEILGMSDRIAVMQAGTIRGVLDRKRGDAGEYPGARADKSLIDRSEPRTAEPRTPEPRNPEPRTPNPSPNPK